MGPVFHETMPGNVEAFIDIESPPVTFNIIVLYLFPLRKIMVKIFYQILFFWTQRY